MTTKPMRVALANDTATTPFGGPMWSNAHNIAHNIRLAQTYEQGVGAYHCAIDHLNRVLRCGVQPFYREIIRKHIERLTRKLLVHKHDTLRTMMRRAA